MFRGQDRDFGEPGYVKAGLAGAAHFHSDLGRLPMRTGNRPIPGLLEIVMASA